MTIEEAVGHWRNRVDERSGGGRCASCGDQLALSAGRSRVTSDGRIELECAPCARGERPVVAAVESPIETRRTPARRRSMFAAGAGVIAVTAVATMMGGGRDTGDQAAAEAAAERESRGPAWTITEPDEPGEDVHVGPPDLVPAEDPTPLWSLNDLPPLPERDGESIVELLPTLEQWVHPVPGSPEIVPTKSSRLFGAHRAGVAVGKCGGGHCGVDLEGDRGQPVIAVAWGTVARIQPSASGRGGRYVKIEHPDFVYTTYFHLDAIAPGLQVGDEVEPGTAVGTLGRSGIRISMPHLHFALELPDEDQQIRFVDPAPYLARAEVLDRDAVPELEVVKVTAAEDAAAEATWPEHTDPVEAAEVPDPEPSEPVGELVDPFEPSGEHIDLD